MATPSLHPPARDASLGPATPDEAWRWLFAALAGYAAGAVLAIVLTSIGASVAGVRGGASALAARSSPPVWFLVLSYVGLWSGLGAAAWWATRTGRTLGGWLRFGDSRYVLLGVALQVVVSLAYVPANQHALARPERMLLGGGTGWLLALSGALTVLGAPIFEELFFRGVLLRGLLGVLRRTPVGVVVAVAVDGLVFGLAHLGTDQWIELPALSALGAVLAVLAIRTRRLGPSMVTHASFNAVAVFLYVSTR